MNTIRILISIFLVVLALAAVAGFAWATNLEQPPLIGGRIVLLIGGLACLFAVKVLWSETAERAH